MVTETVTNTEPTLPIWAKPYPTGMIYTFTWFIYHSDNISGNPKIPIPTTKYKVSNKERPEKCKNRYSIKMHLKMSNGNLWP